MVLFIGGMAVGAILMIFFIGIISAVDEEYDEEEIKAGKKCKNCLYQPYDNGKHDCAACHEAGEL